MDELTRENGKMRLVMSKSALHDTEDEIVYWMTKSPEERVAAVEVLRQRIYGSNGGPGPRLQRVSRVVHS